MINISSLSLCSVHLLVFVLVHHPGHASLGVSGRPWCYAVSGSQQVVVRGKKHPLAAGARAGHTGRRRRPQSGRTNERHPGEMFAEDNRTLSLLVNLPFYRSLIVSYSCSLDRLRCSFSFRRPILLSFASPMLLFISLPMSRG